MNDYTQDPLNSQNTQTAAPDVAAEMHRIRGQIRQQRPTAPAVPKTYATTSIDWTEIQDKLRQAKEKWNVRELPFESPIPIIGPLIAAFRSAWNSVAAKWHVRRILIQQNAYNLVIYQLLEGLYQELETQGRINADLAERLHQQERISADLVEQLRQQDKWRQELELRLLAMRRAAAALSSSPTVDTAGSFAQSAASSTQAASDCKRS